MGVPGRVLGDELLPLGRVDRLGLAGTRFVGGAAGELDPQAALSELEGSVPVDRGGARSDLGVVGSLRVAERREGFDMAGVLEPAAGDDVVVQMREPLAERRDPRSQRRPLLAGFARGEVEPVDRPRQLVEVGGTLGFVEF